VELGGRTALSARTQARLIAAAAALVAGLGSAVASASAQSPPSDFAGVHASYADVIRGADDPRSLAGHAGTGIGIARVWVSWTDVEVAPGRYDFTSLDSLVDHAARGGLRLLPVLVYPPRFRSAGPPGAGGYPPAAPADMALFARYLAGRYGPRGTFWSDHPATPRAAIRSWQIWNEPNLSPWWEPGADAAGYVRLLRSVGAGLERCDPDAEVVAAGLPNSHPWLGPPLAEYLDAMYRAGGRGTFDALAVHPYGSETWRVMAQVEEARAVADRYGDRAPIWVTELGWGTGGPPVSITVSASRQAQLLSETVGQLYARRAELGIRGFVYYQWIDLLPAVSQNDDSVWHHIGLLEPDGREKPALGAYAGAIRSMRLPAPAEPAAAPPLPGCAPPAGAVVSGPGGTAGTAGGDAAAGSADGSRQAGPGGGPAAACRPAAGRPCPPELSRVRLRPARFRPAAGGPPLRPGGRCGPATSCGRAGARLVFRATRATVELRLSRGSGRRERAVGPVVRFKARAGDNELRLLGRLNGRPLPPGGYRVTLQLVDATGRRSKPVGRRFAILR
jgi:hypothetical protein